MRRVLVGLVAVVVLVTASLSLIQRVAAQPPGGGPGGTGRPPGGPPGWDTPVDSFATERDSLMKVVLADLGDRASQPAESVFKNLKVVKGRTAEQVLRMMNYGFGHSLGVRCQHCHVLGHWSEEDKNTKQIARDMMAMTGRINNELLPAIKNIKSEHAGVNCGTCHHGIARPGFGPMQAMQQPPPPGAPPPGAKH